jgi:hypothetical protein
LSASILEINDEYNMILGKREFNVAYRVLLRVTILIIVRGKVCLSG